MSHVKPVVVDVREADEFLSERVRDSIHVALSDFPRVAPALLKHFKEREVVLLCQSGTRSGMALKLAQTWKSGARLSSHPGGLQAWKEEGLPGLELGEREVSLPLMRQVQLGAGGLVLLSLGLASLISWKFLALAAFVGTGLMVAGSTGFCGMAILLDRMPWNRGSS